MGARTGLYVVAVVLLVVGVFYAFNAYIQLQERGFTEPMDVPIAAVGLVAGALVLWTARRLS